MKNIKNLTTFRSGSLKTKVIIVTTIMGIALVSVGSINNANYKNSSGSMDKNIKVFSSVYATQYGVTTGSNLSVRSGAGTNYAILGSMKIGAKVIITGKTNNFYKITYNGKIAYVSALYVKITAKPVVVVTPPAVYKTQYGVTTGSNLSVRSGAGTNYAILGSMKIGTKVIITGKTNNFYKVTYNGKIAYVSAQYVKITAKPVVVVIPPAVYKTQYGVTTGSNLSVRSGAGTNYAILGSMKIGTKVVITGKTNNFYKVTYNGKAGYVSALYIKITAKPVVVPAVYGGTVQSKILNVRSGAGTNYSIIGSVKAPTIVMISGETNGFYKIAYNGKIGYVSSEYVIPVGSKVTD
ncbi:SH3 domain-containing protein [Clostridium psychrophilum]|uniref:SH3 domain-containing protein n=1 Tax=Clostridium psychrophilum TaxID=132926 RepID=UPI001C0B8384|nr:SH3 domain-containing protein [Clostridium psychrophilum]MBU3182146.1 SH3 domain-containing protein [Clostridium psychrophilum]